MSTMMELIRDMAQYRLSPNSIGLDEGVRRLQEELHFDVHEAPGGYELSGWVIPKQWEVERATIHEAGAMLVEGAPIYDGKAHPLGVMGYSQPFQGFISGSELKDHLVWCATDDDALIYSCDAWYKPHKPIWGFSVPKRLYDSIVDRAMYYVDLETTFGNGTMKIAEHVLPGKTRESITLLAHTCHATLCNDDLSGVAVGVEVMRRLARIHPRQHTYRLLLSPEHYGPLYYLEQFGGQFHKGAIFLEMLGTTGPLVLQRSFQGNTALDTLLTDILSQNAQDGQQSATSAPFRTIVGNCETTLEAPPYLVPCPSLSRWPYPAYHTSRDTIELMDESKLEESVQVVMEALLAIDRNATMHRHFTGLVALSNPKYDLYKPYFDPSVEGRRTIDDDARQFNWLMNCWPMYMDDSRYSLLDIAHRFRLPFKVVYDYAKQWEAKGLCELWPVGLSRPVQFDVPPR